MLQLQERVKQRQLDKAALNVSEQKLKLVERVAHLGSWTWHLRTSRLEWSEEMLRIFGLEGREFSADLPTVMNELIHPEDRAAVEHLNQQIAEGCHPDALEYKITRPDGTIRVICTEVAEFVRDRDGQLLTAVGIVQDITERRNEQEALRDSQAKLRAALSSMTDAVLVCDAAGRFVDFNAAFAAFHRFEDVADCFEKLDQYARLFQAFDPGGELVPFDQWPVSRALRGESVSNAEYTLRRTDLGVTWSGSFSFAPIRDACGRVVGSVTVARDITELKKAEQSRLKLEVELQQAQKMESIGRLAGGVAHDFNNMLAVILGHIEMAMESVTPDQPLHEDLEQIQQAAKRSADLTRQLLAFARQQTVAPRVLLLDDTMAGMTKMLRRLIGENVELELKSVPGLWPVSVDPSQIDQVLANLCVNARDAISGVGKITVELSNTTLTLSDCGSLPGVSPGEYVRLVVRDTGQGMDEETLNHLFEPFFTTKSIGRGTGLGLATVYGIIKQNQGFISIRSAPKQGSEFTIHLPRHGSVTELAEGRRQVTTLLGHEVVLLVEDEPGILRVTKRLLEQLGYFVLAAGSTCDALSLARSHAGKIDLILTDVVMPEMNGRDLANTVEAHHPRIKRLFMSGHTRDVIADQGVLDRGINFIQKPFAREDLANKLRMVLDGSPAS